MSNKLYEYIEDNSKKRMMLNQMKSIIEEVNKNQKNDEELIRVLEEKQQLMQSTIQNKTNSLRKLEIHKEVISDKLEKSQNRKLELERILNERNTESIDLKIKFQVLMEKHEAPVETSQIEELKEKLVDEQKKFKKNQAELQELQLRFNLALKEQLNDRHQEEKSVLDREIQAREMKISELEKEVNEIDDSTKLVKRIVSGDEGFINLNIAELEAKLKELAEMYKILSSRQSSSNIEKQINVRKVSRLNERIIELEKELKIKNEQLAKAEAEANRFLDTMANQSILNKVRVPIRGGGGKGTRNQTYSRLSIKPRMFASMTMKLN